MKAIYLLLIMFVIYENVAANPVLREGALLMEDFEPEEKIREKRKSGLLDHLQAEGIGLKKSVADEVPVYQKPKADEALKVELPPALEDEASDVEEESTRAKKQAVDNVRNGGKTSCGRVISARGPSAKMLMLGDSTLLHTGQNSDVDSKLDRYQSMQSRTFDPLIPLTSLTSSVAYAVPATSYSAADTTAALAHTLPAIAAPAVPVAPVAPITHLESLPLISHTLPIHPMHTMFTHRPLLNLNLQRMELPKLQEIIYTPAEVKQPAYEVKPIVARPVATTPFLYSSRYGSINGGYDGPMICHPLGDERASQQVIQIRPEVHVIESGQKNLNTSVEEFKAQLGDTMGDDEEKKVREHLRQVNEIREEITQLNKAAQKIVDQQERLAEMQQRHLWRSGERAGYTPYNDLRMYMVPPTHTRANALAYPGSMDDIAFFMNLLQAGKNLGTLSNTFQPAITSALDATRVVFGGEQGVQSGASQPKVNRGKQDPTNGQNNDSKQNN